MRSYYYLPMLVLLTLFTAPASAQYIDRGDQRSVRPLWLGGPAATGGHNVSWVVDREDGPQLLRLNLAARRITTHQLPDHFSADRIRESVAGAAGVFWLELDGDHQGISWSDGQYARIVSPKWAQRCHVVQPNLAQCTSAEQHGLFDAETGKFVYLGDGERSPRQLARWDERFFLSMDRDFEGHLYDTRLGKSRRLEKNPATANLRDPHVLAFGGQVYAVARVGTEMHWMTLRHSAQAGWEIIDEDTPRYRHLATVDRHAVLIPYSGKPEALVLKAGSKQWTPPKIVVAYSPNGTLVAETERGLLVRNREIDFDRGRAKALQMPDFMRKAKVFTGRYFAYVDEGCEPEPKKPCGQVVRDKPLWVKERIAVWDISESRALPGLPDATRSWKARSRKSRGSQCKDGDRRGSDSCRRCQCVCNDGRWMCPKCVPCRDRDGELPFIPD